MFDCIYRDEVKQKIKERMKYLDDARIMNKGDTEILNQIKGFEKALNQIYCDIDDIRTAVQPVKHGRWEYIRNVKLSGTIKLCECSICHNKIFGGLSYCGNCGARMDGGAKND